MNQFKMLIRKLLDEWFVFTAIGGQKLAKRMKNVHGNEMNWPHAYKMGIDKWNEAITKCETEQRMRRKTIFDKRWWRPTTTQITLSHIEHFDQNMFGCRWCANGKWVFVSDFNRHVRCLRLLYIVIIIAPDRLVESAYEIRASAQVWYFRSGFLLDFPLSCVFFYIGLSVKKIFQTHTLNDVRSRWQVVKNEDE